MIEIAKLNAMLDAELEMAAAWKSLTPAQRADYLKSHPFSRFKKGGMREHLKNLGWKKTGRNQYSHSNGRTLQIHHGGAHRYNFSVTHPNGDVSHHKINNDTSAAWALTKHSNVSKDQQGKRKPKTVAPVAKAPAPAAAPAKKPSLFQRLRNLIHPNHPEAAPAPVKRGRGRPRKVAVESAPAAAPIAPKHRGRPRKVVAPTPAPAPVVAPKHRGRPKKVVAPVAAPVSPAPVAKRGRGRPRKVVAPAPAPVAAKPVAKPVSKPVAAPAPQTRAPIKFKPKEAYEPAPAPAPTPITKPKKNKVNRTETWA